ncbi:MAG: S8 family serine peptidase [Chloroflexota bacterium]
MSIIVIATWLVSFLEGDRAFGSILKAYPAKTYNYRTLEQSLKQSENGELRVIAQVDFRNFESARIPDKTSSEYGQAVYNAQERMLDQLPAGSFNTYAQFKTIPFVALTVNEEGLNALAKLPEVVHVQEDIQLTVSLDSTIPIVGADEAWAEGYTGRGQTVVVIDTGIDRNHPFFQNRVVSEACFSNAGGEGGGTSLCPNGQSSQTGLGASDPKTGACLYNGTNLCVHGTHVAGIAAGENSDFSGVAPDANLVGIQAFTRIDSFDCIIGTLLPACLTSNFSDILLSLEHVYTELRFDHTIASINMSLGGEKHSDQSACDAAYPSVTQIIEQLKDAGIATVIASGNDSWTDSLSMPGCISHAIAVGSIDDDESIASYSNIHPMVDLLAPGSKVSSAVPGPTYESFSGTSMAAPHVAGAWAVLKQLHPNESVDQILARFSNTGRPIKDDRAGATTSVPRIDLGAMFGPNISITPEEFSFDVESGDPISFDLIISNDGQSDLIWNVGPFDLPARTLGDEVRLTHSLSRDVVVENSLSCATGHSLIRVFDLNAFEISDPLRVTAVEFGVQSSSSFVLFPPAIELRLYTMSGDEPTLENLTLIGTSSGNIGDHSLAVISAPADIEVPAGSKLVVELHNPAPVLLESLVFGSNSAGQTGPTYYYAPSCEVDEITNVSNLGYPNMHFVMEVVGETIAPPPVCNEWVQSERIVINPNAGTLSPENASTITVNLQAQGLKPGVNSSHICFETNTTRNPVVYIPVTINVPCPDGEVCEPAESPTPDPAPTTLPPTETPSPPTSSPQADFSVTPTSGIAPLTVQFINSSSGKINNTEWQFGDGNSSPELSPSHVFTSPGVYTSTLTVTNDDGSSTHQKVIEVYEAVNAVFSADRQIHDQTPTSVTFTNSSTGDFESCEWDFGDGTQSDSCDERVPHTYSASGEYSVSLMVSGNGGSSASEIESYITVVDKSASDERRIYLPFVTK